MKPAAFIDPPFFCANTVLATMVRVAKALGKGPALLRKVGATEGSDARCSKVFAGYEPTEHDVFVATYSKSGTNWAMQVAQQIAWRGAAEFGHIYDVVAWPDTKFAGVVPLHDTGPQERSPVGKRLIKTSIRASFVPYSEKAAYLSVLRDPKDVFVSAYHFVSGMFELHDHVPLEYWLQLWLDDEFPAGSWPEHADSYWKLRDRDNVLVLPFADLKADLPGSVRRVAELMGVSLTEAEHAAVVERSSFEFMKSWEDKFRPPRFRFTAAAGTMIRKGTVGGSGELLSREQQAQIDRYCLDRLEALGSELPYEDLFDVVRV